MSRTNRINRLVVLSVMISAGALIARSAVAAPPPNPEDLTQGKWELNVEKSKFCNPAAAPKKSGREDVDVGWGMISVKSTGVNAKGQSTEGWYVYRYDGGKYPANIDRVPTEYIVWKLVNPHRVEFAHHAKDDHITQSYVRVVSDDGQTMTQTLKRTGQTCEDVQVFERQ
jgi:hypothetical protein